MKLLRIAACLAAVLLYACVLPLWAAREPDPARAALSPAAGPARSPQEALLALATSPAASEAQRARAQEGLERLALRAGQEEAVARELEALGLGACTVELGENYACVYLDIAPDADQAAAALAAVAHIAGLDPGRVRIIPR